MGSARYIARDGSAWILGMLAASLLLVAMLAWQAFDAALSHREAAEAVLGDYAQLAADEFVRRTASEIGYAYYRILTALGRYRSDHPDSLPERGELAEADPRNQRALTLVRYFFQLDPATLDLETAAGPAPGGATVRWLGSGLSPPERDGAMSIANVEIEGVPRSFVYASASGSSLSTGFEVETASVTAWFGQALERRPLLPPSLGLGADDTDHLALTVRDAADREVFSTGRADPGPYGLSATARYGDTYEGVFDGLSVTVALHPETAGMLVIGGLPRSRLPTLVGLLLLTVGLLSAAIFQLRRERSLARLRSDFVSQVSHELRTPLTQIRMFAETLLLGRVRSDEEGRRSLEIVDREARRLSQLVENILQFSRSERGTMRLDPAPRELAPLVRDLVRGFAPLVGRREVSFVVHPADGVTAMVDDDALRQILLNLLDNAVKYGPPKQRVVIGLERTGDGWARLSVDDEGPGIAARDRPLVWRSFRRLDRDRRSAVAGTGIGLAVVRDLVALQGGRVRIEEGERGGARFVVELPLAPSERARRSEAAAEEVPA